MSHLNKRIAFAFLYLLFLDFMIKMYEYNFVYTSQSQD